MTLRWEAFLEEVRERGEYDTPQEAERAARVVLALLGAHLVGEVCAELAARLPETMALVLLNPLQAAEPLNPERGFTHRPASARCPRRPPGRVRLRSGHDARRGIDLNAWPEVYEPGRHGSAPLAVADRAVPRASHRAYRSVMVASSAKRASVGGQRGRHRRARPR